MTTAGELSLGLAEPGDPRYDEATAVLNLCGPPRPAWAVTATSAEHVQAVIRHAASRRLTVRMHATGHASAGSRPVGGGVLIRTDLAENVEIDGRRRMARIPAGTQWGAVVPAAARHKLAVAHGSTASVGAVGYLLRGGLSPYGRKVGLAVNCIRAIEVVTADGELRRVDASNDPELFWALRGGGGGLGVVTAVEIELFEMDRVFSGAAYWPVAHAGELLAAWRRWAGHAPWEATTWVRVMNLPLHPAVKQTSPAEPVLCLGGAITTGDGGAAELRRSAVDLLEPMRAIASPILDTWRMTTPGDVLEVPAGLAEPVAVVGDHMLLSEIGDEGAAEFCRMAEQGCGSPLTGAGLRQLGGAFAVTPPGAGALSSTAASYAYLASGTPSGSLTRQAIRGYLAQVRQALRPWDTGKTILSFIEDYSQPQGNLTPDQVAAVDAVRRRVDPDGLFRFDVAPSTSVRY